MRTKKIELVETTFSEYEIVKKLGLEGKISFVTSEFVVEDGKSIRNILIRTEVEKEQT